MSFPPSPYPAPGPPLNRPELPEGVDRPPLPPPRAPGSLPDWPLWSPFAAMLLTLVVALVGVIVLYVIAQAFGVDADADDTPPGVTIGGTIIQDLALIVSAWIFARMTAGAVTPAQFGFRLPRLGSSIGWLFAAWLAFIVFSATWAAALSIENSDDLPQDLGADESTAALVGTVVLVTVFAPICEELFFRGFLFTAARRKLGMAAAAVVTGVVFGGIHAGGTDIEFLVPLAFFGTVLCLLYWVTGSLLACIVLHGLNNSLALGVSLDWSAGETLALMAGSAVVLLALTIPVSRRAPAVARA